MFRAHNARRSFGRTRTRTRTRTLPHSHSHSHSRSCSIHSSAPLFLLHPHPHPLPHPRSRPLPHPHPHPHLDPHRSFSSRPSSSSSSSSSSSMYVFDRRIKLAQRARSVYLSKQQTYDYLRDEIAKRLCDRIQDISRTFDTVVDIGAGIGSIGKHLGEAGKIKHLIQIHHNKDEVEQSRASTSPSTSTSTSSPIPSYRRTSYVIGDEEHLPLQPKSCDMIVSSMNMHWVNDLPGMLSQVQRALKPDGVFLAAMLGGETLQELRSAFAIADSERLGGVTNHVSPFAKARDCGDLLSRANFSMPTVDWDILTIRYPDMFTLCHHLQGMGENNCVIARPPSVSRDIFLAAASAYQTLYEDEEGLVPATFQILYMIGWSPASSQPKPMERGTASHSLAQLTQVAQKDTQTSQTQTQTETGTTATATATSTAKDHT